MDIAYLVKRAKKGHDEAFEQLIAPLRERLYRTAYAYVRNEQDALDMYQEAIYEAYVSLHKLKKPEKFNSWITQIIIFKAIDFIRKSAKQFVASDETFAYLATEENISHLVKSMDLTEAFHYLSPAYKTIILLRYYYDFSIKEIADQLNYPEGTVKSQLHRARNALRPILEEGYSYE